LCILRITINHTHSYDVSFRSFAIFFFCLSSRPPKIPYTLDDDEKKNNKNTDEESSALSSQIKKSSQKKMSQKKNICLSSSFFSDSDLSLSFSRRRQK